MEIDLRPNKFCILGRNCTFKNQLEPDIATVLFPHCFHQLWEFEDMHAFHHTYSNILMMMMMMMMRMMMLVMGMMMVMMMVVMLVMVMMLVMGMVMKEKHTDSRLDVNE